MGRDIDLTRELPAAHAEKTVGQTTISSLVHVDVGAMSHRGKVRPNNEDYYLVARLDRAMHTVLTNLSKGIPLQSSETGYGMLVADGMGGAAAG